MIQIQKFGASNSPNLWIITLGGRNISHNTWIHRLVTIGVRPLAKTPVTPNQLTTLRLAAGLAAAALFAMGDRGADFWASGVFILSLFLDRADGILARITGRTSPFGHKYDLVADGLSNASVFVGIGIGVRDGALGLWSLPLGVLAGGAVTVILWLVMRTEDRAGPRAAELGGAAGFDPDDAMLAVPVAVLLGWATPLLLAAAVLAPAFALFFFWRFRRHLAGGED